jgi:hypothetical protein
LPIHDAWYSLLIQTRNQLILRLAEITITSERTGEKTAVSILERFPLTLPGAKKPPGVRRASTVQPSHRAGTPSLMNRPNATNFRFPSPIDDMQVRQLEKFTDWARTAVKCQQNDINRIGAAIDRMERDMNSFRDFVQEIRTELTTYHQFQESLKDKELPVLREDLKGLRIEVDANRQFQNTLTEEEFPVLQEDIDALRSELAKSQQFQQQLKHHDLKILGQNLQGLRLSLGDLANQKEDKFKLSHAKFDTLMDEVREVNRKANEIEGVRAELEYFKARIASLESSARETLISGNTETPRVERASEPKTGTIPGLEDKVHWAEALQPSTHTQQSRYEWCEKRDHSLPKRWNFHAENNDEVPYEPPTKRLRRSVGRASTRYLSVPFQTPKSPIVVSSNHGTPSPILDRHDLRNEGGGLNNWNGSRVQFKDQEDDIRGVPQLTHNPPQTNQEHLGKRQPLSRSTMPPVSNYPTSDLSQEAVERPRGISASSVSPVTVSRRASNKSLQNNLISDPLDEKRCGDNITLLSSSGRLDRRPFRHKARYSNMTNDNSIIDLRPQDCGGALLNPGETPGERSYQLRGRVSSKENDKPKYARQRSETPDQLSIIIADEAMQKSVPRRASDGAKARGSNVSGRSVRAPKGNIGKRSSRFRDISEAHIIQRTHAYI